MNLKKISGGFKQYFHESFKILHICIWILNLTYAFKEFFLLRNIFFYIKLLKRTSVLSVWWKRPLINPQCMKTYIVFTKSLNVWHIFWQKHKILIRIFLNTQFLLLKNTVYFINYLKEIVQAILQGFIS